MINHQPQEPKTGHSGAVVRNMAPGLRNSRIKTLADLGLERVRGLTICKFNVRHFLWAWQDSTVVLSDKEVKRLSKQAMLMRCPCGRYG